MNAGDRNDPDRLERALQVSLRAVDPGADFTAAVQARLAVASVRALPAAPRLAVPSVRQRRLHAASLAMAASIVVALAGSWQLLDLRTEARAQLARQEQARIHRQLLLALEITSERLGQAQQHIEQYQSQENHL